MSEIKLNFDCTKDKIKSNEIKKHVKNITYIILNEFGAKNIKSIILTGSIARGEAAVININGKFIDMLKHEEIKSHFSAHLS